MAGGVSDDIITNLLTTAATTHFDALKVPSAPPITTPTSGPLPIPQGKHLSFEYFKMANPDYVYRLADTMMGYTSSEVSILVLKVGILVVRLVY